VHLAGWPTVADPDRGLIDEIAEVRRVVALAHQARSSAGLKLRQPLRRLVVEGVDGARAHAAEIAAEVRVKEVEFAAVDAELVVKPNLPVLGPRLGKDLRVVQQALRSGEFEPLGGGRFRVAGHDLEPNEVLVERRGQAGSAVASADGITVSLDTVLDDELLLEGRAYDVIRAVNTMRKDAGLELTDRIVLTVPEADADVFATHGDRIKAEVLATELRVGGELGISKAG